MGIDVYGFACSPLAAGRFDLVRGKGIQAGSWSGGRLCDAARSENSRLSSLRQRRCVIVASSYQQYEISRSDDYAVLEESAEFFVDAFWGASTTTSADATNGGKLDDETRRQFVAAQTDDMSSRYGKLMGKRRLSSSFFVARNARGQIQACSGIEIAVVTHTSEDGYNVLSREKSEKIFSSTMASLPATARSSLRKAKLADVAAAVFAQQQTSDVKYSLHPVLSNLAVAASARGQGLGQHLVKVCEDQARAWDSGMFEDVWLIVEELNTAAKSLYEKKLGYETIWRTENTNAVRVANEDSGAKIQTVPAVHLLMSKQL